MIRFRCLILLSLMILATAVFSFGEVFISVRFGPPPLPVYAQPFCPGPGYIWVPGYWAWSPDPDGYYWVPGTWVLAPEPGFLWTPGYWGFSAGLYYWHPGYWGPVVGFYGGINYGFGYPGDGYYGGYWHGRDFYYNRTVNNVNITNVRYVYNRPVNDVTVSRASYNGGQGGIQARPTPAQMIVERKRHMAATSAQVRHQQAARSDPAQFVSRNHGRPAVVATPRPGALNAREATRAKLPVVNRSTPTPRVNNARRVPAPPQNHQQARAPKNVPRPNNTARQAAPAPRVNKAPRPNTAVNHRPAPQVRNAPRQETGRRAAPAPRPEPQRQARQANHPPPPALRQHAVARPAPNMRPRPPQPHQAEPPRQSAARQAPSLRGREEGRPR
jgi:WXXGXW repeat (2 copies)